MRLHLVNGHRPRPLSRPELDALTAEKVAAWKARRESAPVLDEPIDPAALELRRRALEAKEFLAEMGVFLFWLFIFLGTLVYGASRYWGAH